MTVSHDLDIQLNGIAWPSKALCSPKPVQGVPFLSIWNSTQSPNQTRCITLLKHWSSCVPTSSMLCAFCQQHLVLPLKNFPHVFSSNITTIPCILVNSNDWKHGPELRSFWQGYSLPKTTVPLEHIFSVLLYHLIATIFESVCGYGSKSQRVPKVNLIANTWDHVYRRVFWQHVPASWLKDFTTAGSGGCTPPFSYGNDNSIHHLKVVLGLANSTTLIWVNICSINECHTCTYNVNTN